MFELTVVKFMPASSHSKLPGLCKTRWVERHICFEVFLELYEPLITFLDAIYLQMNTLNLHYQMEVGIGIMKQK